MKVWGVSVSYYTGKLEAYLRYKGIAYEMQHPFADQARIRKLAGAVQVPIVEREDGRFMSDSTPTIQQLEKEFPARPVFPSNPVVRFIALLIEDYADEWLWRSAMHYRWSYEHDRELLSRILADEVTTHLPLPRFVRRYLVKRRQRTRFVLQDGVIGLMGPMLRHFGQDPTPAAIMRNEWPAIAEWVARVWNAGTMSGDTSLLETVPADAALLLKEIAETHIVQLRENALAYGRGQRTFEMQVQDCHYQNLPVSRYRVYCLERLREEFHALSPDQQTDVRSHLPQAEYALLWEADVAATSLYDVDRQAPFNKAINVLP